MLDEPLSTGFISLETTLVLKDNGVSFQINSKMYLSTERSPFRNDFMFGPAHLELCSLSYREMKDLSPILRNFQGDTYIATIMDLLIRNSDKVAFDPVKEPNSDIVCFFSPLTNRKQDVPFTHQSNTGIAGKGQTTFWELKL